MNIVVNEVISKVIVVNKGLKGDDGDMPDGALIDTNNLSDVDNTTTARQNLGAISNVESIVNSLIFG